MKNLLKYYLLLMLVMVVTSGFIALFAISHYDATSPYSTHEPLIPYPYGAIGGAVSGTLGLMELFFFSSFLC